jgi:hypothetical protein
MEKSQENLAAPLQSVLGDNQRALFDSAIKMNVAPHGRNY